MRAGDFKDDSSFPSVHFPTGLQAPPGNFRFLIILSASHFGVSVCFFYCFSPFYFTFLLFFHVQSMRHLLARFYLLF